MTVRFELYPAIDLRHGRVVRLEEGDPARQTIFGDDPVAVAAQWASQGARWLHVVNLDGAFDESGRENWAILADLAALDVPVQFGGGLRLLDDIARALDAGAARVVLGTAAIERPELVSQALTRFGDRAIAVGIDARDGRVRSHGWQQAGGLSAETLGRRLRALGVRTAVHTDISRDGLLAGANVAASAALAQATGLEIIVSGGAASLEEVDHALVHAGEGIAGLIIGRALYDGKIRLAEAYGRIRAKAC